MTTLSHIATLKTKSSKDTYEDASFCDVIDDCTVFGVFDGHYTQDTAHFACQFLRRYLRHNLPRIKTDKVEKLLVNAFHKCQTHMIASTDDKYSRSGASALVGIVIEDDVWVAHVGDCACYFVTREALSHFPVVKSEVHDLRKDEEKIRVLDSGGWYRSVRGKDEDICDKKVSVTRALGHLWQIVTLSYWEKNNLKYYNSKSLWSNDVTPEKVDLIIKERPPTWCIDSTPTVTRHCGVTTQLSHMVAATNSFVDVKEDSQDACKWLLDTAIRDPLGICKTSLKKVFVHGVSEKKRIAKRISDVTALVFAFSALDAQNDTK